MKRTMLGAVTICAGAPLLALGVGAATASADTNSTSPGTSTTQQTASGGLAISAGGLTLVQTGNSTADSYGLSLAVAYNNSHASARGVRKCGHRDQQQRRWGDRDIQHVNRR